MAIHYDFGGRVALITGGGAGIGAAAARLLADAGATVAIFDRELSGAVGDLLLHGDVTQSAELDDAVARISSRYGRLDILVCAAGVAGRSARSQEIDDADWLSTFAVNAHGTFYANRAAARVMTSAGYGRIVNLASIAGKEGNPMDAAYSASKAAVISLTKSFGKDLARTGVLVNCVSPGPTRTAMTETMDDERRDYIVSRIPLGRLADPAEICALIAFCASPACSFATGAIFDASGGRAVY